MTTIVLDDRDPAIKYVGQWFKGGNANSEYEGTTTWCTPAPDTSAILSFLGTGVAVLGTIQSEDVQISSYSLDGDPSTNFTSAKAPGSHFSQRFFSVDSLANGNHTLVVTPIKGTLLVDLITVQQATTVASAAGAGTSTLSTDANPSDLATPIPISNSTTEAAITTAQSDSTNVQNSTVSATSATQTVTPSNQSHETLASKKGPTSIWEIVGGLSAGLTALCLLVLGVYFGMQRRRARAKAGTSSKPCTSVTPYDFISNSSPAGDVDLGGNESLYATSGVADCGDTVMGNQQAYSHAICTNSGRMGKATATLDRDSSSISQDVSVPSNRRTSERGSTSPPPMYQTEVGER